MGRVRLSEAQHRLLSKLGKGGSVRIGGGTYPYAFAPGIAQYRIDYRTAVKLRDLDLIEEGPEQIGRYSTSYVISAAGRAWLEG